MFSYVIFPCSLQRTVRTFIQFYFLNMFVVPVPFEAVEILVNVIQAVFNWAAGGNIWPERPFCWLLLML
jgi:hypothetical protein